MRHVGAGLVVFAVVGRIVVGRTVVGRTVVGRTVVGRTVVGRTAGGLVGRTAVGPGVGRGVGRTVGPVEGEGAGTALGTGGAVPGTTGRPQEAVSNISTTADAMLVTRRGAPALMGPSSVRSPPWTLRINEDPRRNSPLSTGDTPCLT